MSGDAPVLDPSAIERLRRLGGDALVQRMIQAFRESVAARMDALDTGLDHGDLDGVERAAHSVKSSAGNLGLARLQQAAARLEAVARDGDARAVPDGAASMRAALDAALAELEQTEPGGRAGGGQTG